MIRIYTEDKNRPGVLAILDSHFTEGYTVIPAIGRWHGANEPSLVIELSGVPIIAAKNAAREIKALNRQEAVLVSVTAQESFLL